VDLSQLKPAAGAVRERKRVGRGNASGKGTTAGKGTKGQQSRSGKKQPYRGFEGGQARLYRKLARKRGFINQFRVEYEPINVGDLARFDAQAVVTPDELAGAGLIKHHPRLPVKVLAGGELDKALTVRAHKFSSAAKEKIEAAGGRIEALDGAEAVVGRKRTGGANGATAIPAAEAETPGADRTQTEAEAAPAVEPRAEAASGDEDSDSRE
jgi:large subunit ribosomal protein L15